MQPHHRAANSSAVEMRLGDIFTSKPKKCQDDEYKKTENEKLYLLFFYSVTQLISISTKIIFASLNGAGMV